MNALDNSDQVTLYEDDISDPLYGKFFCYAFRERTKYFQGNRSWIVLDM
jgi:hypothetical protein